MQIVGSVWFNGTKILANVAWCQAELQTVPRLKPPIRPYFAILTPFTSASQVARRSDRPATVPPTAPNKEDFSAEFNLNG